MNFRSPITCQTSVDGAANLRSRARGPQTIQVQLRHFKLVTILLVSVTLNAAAAVRYVDASSANPAAPYTNWSTAALTIQDAVDIGNGGDEIVVTNGIYRTGGKVIYNSLTNRVAVDKPLVVRSVNGPQFTVIQGRQVPITTNGAGAVRCVYLTNGASLFGFTLTNGATQGGGDSLHDMSGGGLWCESTNALVTNCVVVGNCATSDAVGGGGGGAYGGTLEDCTLSGNFLTGGGYVSGGGAHRSSLNHCLLVGNSLGGAVLSTLNGCVLSANRDGGAWSCTLNGCALFGNSSGGASGSTLNNCTVIGNWTAYQGGGAGYSTLNNCIVYYNTALGGGDNFWNSTLNDCCTTPAPGGVGNITVEPQLASLTHLSAGSLCRAAGNSAYAVGTDIDGESWASPPSIGCDEYHEGAVNGPLTVAIAASFTNVAVGYPVTLTALIGGRTTASLWEVGDRVVLNRPVVTQTWTVPGDYRVALWAFNEEHPEGVSTNLTIHVLQAVHYVAADNLNPVPPYISWATAATNIQDAIDAATAGGALVLVSNGVYAAGGRAVYGSLTNRVAVDKPLVVSSVNGPQFTVIQGRQVPGVTNGDGAVRCVYLTNGASLFGFTLAGGATRAIMYSWPEISGGGVWSESANPMVSNCVLCGNSAYDRGGGAYGGTIICSTVSSNRAATSGGGAFGSALSNCSLVGNSANDGGGASFSTLSNCVLRGNSANEGGAVSPGVYSIGTTLSVLNDCTIVGNSAYHAGGADGGTLNNCSLTSNSAQFAGGASGGVLNNCVLFANSALGYAGGAVSAELNNCTIVGNSAGTYGGGTVECRQTNCIIYYNNASSNANYSIDNPQYAGISYCCTTPQPRKDFSNITNEPLFMDLAGGDLRLQSNSPCINAAKNSYAPTGPDLDGNPRIVGGTVDIGAYEFQTPASLLSYAWLQFYGLPTDGSADFADADGDGMNNWQEWIAGTNPTNALSVLKMLSAFSSGPGIAVQWQSVIGLTYYLERSTNLSSQPMFFPLQSNLIGQPGTITTYIDANPISNGPAFYRVGVQ